MAPSPARVQGVTLKVEDVLQRLKDGSIRVPTFQRPLKWKREDNRLFFDSLLKNFPVGSLLMWVRDAQAARVEFGPVHLDVQGRPGAWQVVDGQQRLTALAGALLPVAQRASDFDFVVEVETGEVAQPRGRLPPRWVPLAVLADTEQLLLFLHGNPAVDVAKTSTLSKRLREYPLNAAILEADEQAFVQDVFKRLNTAGKRLTATEVFRASHGASKGGTALVRAAQVGNDFHFGTLDESNLLRALKALNGKDPLEDGPADDGSAAVSLERGAAEAVAFLKGIGVPVSELLPYSLLLGVLVAFFGAHPSVAARNRQLLGYWFWRATFTFRMGGDFSVIRRLFALATRPDESTAVQALLEDVGNEMRFPSFDRAPTLRSAEGKALALFLIHNKPRHLLTGEPLPVAELLWTQRAKKLFLQISGETRAMGLLSAVFHPALTRRELLRALNSATPEILASHTLTAPFADTAEYVYERALYVEDLFNNGFMSDERGEMESLRPPLSALADEDAA
jgi:Protein of unknown function DUF262